MIQAITAENVSEITTIAHGFFTRKGGVSEGIYAGLNVGLGSHDILAHVAQNRARVLAAMGANALCTLYQHHSANVMTVTEAWETDALPKADAMVTSCAGLALGILTADCVPVLFADAQAGVIGAAHAGWKGAQGGIVAKTVQAMEKLGAEASRIVAAIGPAIAQESYQVDALFHANFTANDAASGQFFERDAQSASHYRFNLKSYVLAQCSAVGISSIEMLPHNTYGQEDLFYSYRRTCHRGESDYGRQISAIMLKQ